jgi:hypothetical protein
VCTHNVEHKLKFIFCSEIVSVFAIYWVYGAVYFVKLILIDENKEHGGEEERHVHQGVH